MNTPEEPNPFRSPNAVEMESQQQSLVGFWVVLCLTAMVALGLLPFLPGLSILLAIGLAPAFVHAYVRLVKYQQQSGMPRPLRQLGILLGSLVTVLVLGMAAGIVGMVFCYGALVAVSATSSGNNYSAMMVAFLVGIAVPLGLFGFLFARSLGYFQKTETDPPRNDSPEREAE